MKILAPASSAKEGEVLISYGADELYCGIGLSAFKEKRKRTEKDLWVNRRESKQANLSNLEELLSLVQIAHEKEKKVYLTLNQTGYAQDFQTEIISFVKELLPICKVDALIVADPGLIKILKEKFPEIVIHASSLTGILNSSSVRFFRKMGVKRIVFPRYLQPETLKTIIEAGGQDLEYEVFVLNDGCVYEETFCHVSHVFGGAFCHNPRWNYTLVPHDGDERDALNKLKGMKIAGETFMENLDEYKRWQWISIKNGSGILRTKSPGMCALCMLTEYQEMGITSLKIVGREAALDKKTASVKLVNEVLTYITLGHTSEEVRQYAKALRGLKGLCETGYMCYAR